MTLSYLYFSQSSKFNRLKPKVKYRRKQNEIKIDILDFHALHNTLMRIKNYSLRKYFLKLKLNM